VPSLIPDLPKAVKKVLKELGIPIPPTKKLNKLITCVGKKILAGKTIKAAVKSCAKEMGLI
jgi:hypothetical protein